LFPTKKIKLVQNGYTLAERLKPVQNFSLENLHPVSLLSAFAITVKVIDTIVSVTLTFFYAQKRL